MMREQKARVRLIGTLDGQRYVESFVVSCRCADNGTHKLIGWAAQKLKSIVVVKVEFIDWLSMDSTEQAVC